jgi:hypothetical protein
MCIVPGAEEVRAGCQFHAGVLHFREDAPWLDELLAELLGFHLLDRRSSATDPLDRQMLQRSGAYPS